MQIPIYVIDAFITQNPFSGNPAAVCPLKTWLPEKTMQAIAHQNNLSETAFFVPTSQEAVFELRWFTPKQEVNLCGHATLATAFVVFEHLYTMLSEVTFKTKSGDLIVKRDDLWFVMDFPALLNEPIAVTELMAQAIGCRPLEAYLGQDLSLVLPDQKAVEAAQIDPLITPNMHLNRGIIITSESNEPNIDFVSRYFAPELDVLEDPVTGSAHCQLATYWSNQLNKTHMVAKQLSKRGGMLDIVLDGKRVILKGKGRQYLHGFIDI